MSTYNSFKRNKKIWLMASIFIFGLIALSVQTVFGGIFDNYASIKSSPDVESQVKSNQLSDNYNYYYTGRDNLPWAVIGIDSKYTLVSKFWHRIESHDQVINKIKHLMPIVQATGLTYAKILDAGDNQVGVWFSEYSWGVIKFEGNDNIMAISPYEPNDDV